MEMKEIEADDQQNKSSEAAISVAEHDDTSSVRSTIVGTVLAFTSGLLFTANHVTIQQFDLKFSDVSLVRYAVQIMVLILLIKLPICFKQCKKSRDLNQEEGRPEVKHSLWVYNVEEGKSIHIIQLFLVLQGLCNGIFTLGAFICVSRMPIGDFSVIIFSTPLPTMIMARLFLKTRLRLFKITCAALLILGLLLVVRPPALFGEEDQERKSGYYFGALAGLVGTVAGAAHFVLVSILYKNKTTSSPKLLVFHAGLGGLVVSLVSTFLDPAHQILSADIPLINRYSWLEMFFVSVGGVLGFFMLNQAVKLTNPIFVSFIRVSEIVVSYFIQIFLYKQPVDVFGILGSVCVTLAVIIVPLEGWARNNLPTLLNKYV